jgi:asparagine synthase (glutamine-hydrolysing)
MVDPETGHVIVFNGEIYNYPDLRLELEKTGIIFRTQSDTEAILKAYARWGILALERLQGMFAFVLYDALRKRILLARDPLGIKPLYYAWNTEGTFLFASEVRTLAASGLLPVEVDREALASVLAYGAVQEPLTILKGVRLLKAGEWMELSAGAPPAVTSYGRHWHFPKPGSFQGTRREAVAEVSACLDRAMRRHMLSDVPVGLFLSAGADSSALAKVCRRNGHAPEAFTVSMTGYTAADELPLAERTARECGLRHHVLTLDTSRVEEWYRSCSASLDQPTVDGFNTWLITRAIREQGFKVALSGLGGDELFGGYGGLTQTPRLWTLHRLLRKLPAGLRAQGLAFLSRNKTPGQKQKLADMMRPSMDFNRMALMRRGLFSSKALACFGFTGRNVLLNDIGMPLETDLEAGTDPRQPAATLGVLDARFYMRNMLLRDSDVFGMAHGVEIRVPFLDRELIDLVFAMPGAWRRPAGGVNKPLLAEAGGVPRHVIERKKTGFSLPQGHWLKHELVDRRRQALDRLADSGLVDPEGVKAAEAEFEAHPSGPEWSRVWMLMVLSDWVERLRLPEGTQA